MATLAEQITAVDTRVDNLQALLQGARDQGVWYALVGSHIVFGCKITQGASASDLALAIDGNAIGDEVNLNPDGNDSPSRPEAYRNIANIYGEVFLMADAAAAVTVAAAPSTGYHRYDIVYAYVGVAGAALGIATGTPVLNASTPSEPSVPHGVLTLARVHVESDVTGIADAKITDLRDFTGRLRGAPGPTGATGPGTYFVFPAAVTLSGHRAVTPTAGGAVLADHTDAARVQVIGITTGAAMIGADATVQTIGRMDEPSWTWTPNQPIWLGTDGLLTQTPPTTGFLVCLGVAITATSMFINLSSQPLQLA